MRLPTRHRLMITAVAALLATTLTAPPPGSAAPATPTAAALKPGITLVSAKPNGRVGGGFNSVISANGKKVVFYSSGGLVKGVKPGKSQVYVRDLASGKTVLASAGRTGKPANEQAWNAGISGNGRYVVFESAASNLVPGKSKGNLYVRDLVSRTTTAVPVLSGAYDDASHSISDNGKRVGYYTFDNSKSFIYDLRTRRRMRVDVTTKGKPGNRNSWDVSLSGNGQRAAFSSTSTNHTSSKAEYSAYVRDFRSKRTIRLAANLPAKFRHRDTYGARISRDGTAATFLLQLPKGNQLYVRNLRTGKTRLVSASPAGAFANGSSWAGTPSKNGRYVAFASGATNLVRGKDNNEADDVFLRDTVKGTTTLISKARNGRTGNGYSSWASISSNGARVTFSSGASNLIPQDNNDESDIFVWKRR